MVGAVVEGDLEIHQRESPRGPVLHRLDDPLFHRRDVLPGDDSADDFVDELEALPALQGFNLDPGVAELSPAARLLLVLALDLSPPADRLPIGDLGLLQLHLDAVLALELFDGHLQVNLPHAREDQLPGILVALQLNGRVFLHDPVQGGTDLVLVGLALGLQGEGDDRLERQGTLENDRVSAVAQGIPGHRCLQFRHRDDVPGHGLRDRLLLFPLQLEDLADPLRRVAIGIEDNRVRLQGPRNRCGTGSIYRYRDR